jgi:hypothetical protein
MDDFVQKLENVWRCGRLLWMMGSSRMLRHHLVACQSGLHLPTRDNLDSYHRFTNFQPTNGPTDAEVDDADFMEDMKVYVVSGEAIQVVFLEWFRVQARHWIALATLAKAFGAHDARETVPDVYLIAVKHPKSEDNSKEMEPWETTLVDLLKEREDSCPVLDVQDVLGVMCTAIHNEIALASLAVIFHELSATDIKSHPLLADILQVMSYLCDHDAHQSDAMHRTWTEPSLQCQSGAALFVGNS